MIERRSIGMQWRLSAINLASGLLSSVLAATGFWAATTYGLPFELTLLAGVGVGLVGGLITSAWGFSLAREIKHRLWNAGDLAMRISRGELSARLAVVEPDELGELEAQLNQMAAYLEQAVGQLSRLAEQNRLLAEEAGRGAALEERARIARDLHDTVNQQLFVLSLRAAALRKRVAAAAASAGTAVGGAQGAGSPGGAAGAGGVGAGGSAAGAVGVGAGGSAAGAVGVGAGGSAAGAVGVGAGGSAAGAVGVGAGGSAAGAVGVGAGGSAAGAVGVGAGGSAAGAVGVGAGGSAAGAVGVGAGGSAAGAAGVGAAGSAGPVGLDPQLVSELANLEEMARTAHSQIREMILQLRPTTLEQQGLGPALAEYVNTAAERENWVIENEIDQSLRLRGARAEALFRVAQEALNNVSKHARAQRVRVVLQRSEDGEVRLVVADDGVGFDRRAGIRPTAVGLTGMRERMHALGGRLQVRSAPGEGTEVLAVLPPEQPEGGGRENAAADQKAQDGQEVAPGDSAADRG